MNEPEDGEEEDGGGEAPDLEAKYDKAWRLDHIVGGLVAGQVCESDKIDDEILAQVDAAVEAGGLSFTRLDMIANPGEHPSILGLMCKVPWVVKDWPIQKLVNRAQARSRYLK